MMMSKPFFYRITSADFLAAVVTVPEHERGAWVLSLALDMVTGNIETANSSFAKAIITEAAEFSGKKRDAANKRWNAKKVQDDAQHIHSNANSSTITEEPLTKDEEEDLRLAEWIYKLILNVAPSSKKPSFKSWANTIRLMRERDSVGRHKIAETFKWANADSFWMTNILSPSKLREKFPALEAKMKQDSSNDLTPQQKQAKATGGAVY